MTLDRTSAPDGAVTRLAAHVRLPLFRNGYALLFSGITTSGLGILYWALAARLYPAEMVGLNSALLSAMLLLAGMAQLSLNNVLVRFIPVAGSQTGRLVGYAYLASALAAVIFSFIFILGLEVWSPALDFLNQSLAWQWAFGIATLAWCIFSLQDSALTGLRQAVWVPVENTLFALLKIILLVIFIKRMPQAGIFLSWTLPVVLFLLPVNGIIFGWLLPRHPAPTASQAAAPTGGQLLRYMGGNYVGTLLFLAYTNLLPLLVANRAGAEATAYFYLPWMIAGGMQLIATNLSTSLTVEAALNQQALREYCRHVLKQSLRLVLPLVVVIFIGAPWFLRIFGMTYAAQGTALLRWVSLAAIPNVFVALGLGLARVQNRSALIAAIQGALCAGVLGLTYSLLPHFGITGAGIAWLVSQAAVALLLLSTQLRPLFRSEKGGEYAE